MVDEHFEQPASSLRFTLRQVECFLAVAEAGSIAKAAILLSASDSTVADAISAMERSLGAKLFQRRRSHGATLTSDGRTVLPLARRILADGAELTAAVGRDAGAVVGPVRIGCSPTLASLILPQLIVEVGHRFPGIELEYHTDDLAPMIAKIENSELDLVVSFDIDVPPEFENVQLSTTQAMLVVASDHRLADRESASLSEVADEDMVLLDILSSRTHTLELMSARGVTPRIKYRTPDYELCRSLVGRNLGYTLLMRRQVSRDTWDGKQVVYLPIDPAPRAVGVQMSWKLETIPPRVRAVVDCAQSISADLVGAMDKGDESSL